MKIRRTAILAATFVFALAGAFSVTATAKAPPKTALFNLTEEPQVKPSRYFLTANAGPYIKKLKWTNWGGNKTLGTGRFISDCASCGPKENKAAKIVLKGKVYCPKYKVYTYKYGRLWVKDPERKRTTAIPVQCPSRTVPAG